MSAKNSEKKIRTTIVIPVDTSKWLENILNETNLSYSRLINICIDSFIAKYKTTSMTTDDILYLNNIYDIVHGDNDKSLEPELYTNPNQFTFFPDRAFNIDDLKGKKVTMKITNDGYITMNINPESE